mgnify:CR=1 FL=1
MSGIYEIQPSSHSLTNRSRQFGVGGFLKTTIQPAIAKNKAMIVEFGGHGFFGYASGAPMSEKQLM